MENGLNIYVLNLKNIDLVDLERMLNNNNNNNNKDEAYICEESQFTELVNLGVNTYLEQNGNNVNDLIETLRSFELKKGIRENISILCQNNDSDTKSYLDTVRESLSFLENID